MSFQLINKKAGKQPVDSKSGSRVPDAKEVLDTCSEPEVSVTPSVSVTRQLKTAMMGGRGLTKLRTKLAYQYSTTSGANAALNNTNYLILGQFDEYSTFAALFDEVFVHGFEFHFSFQFSAAATTLVRGIVAYDPIDAAASSSLNQLIVCDNHFGPFALNQPFVTPTSVTKTGLFSWKVKCPTGTQSNKSITAMSTGQWAATADTTATFGTLNNYISPAGAAITTMVIYTVVADVSFRTRS